MFYKYSQITNRVHLSDVISTYNPQSFAPLETPKAPPLQPLPSSTATPMASSGGRGGVIHRMNRTKIFQKLFTEPKTADLPVFLRGGAVDAIAYRGVMVFSVIGIGLTLWSIGRIATGRMQKKQ